MSGNRRIVQKNRRLAIEAQGNLCFWCKAPMLPTDDGGPLSATADHYPVERRHGGGNARANIVAAHKICNMGRDKVSANEPSWSHDEWLVERDALLGALKR